MSNLYLIVRWVHVLAGAAWFGEVAVIVFVITPLLGRMSIQERNPFMAQVFPRLFRLASVLAGLALAAGALLNYLLTGWRTLAVYFTTGRWFSLFLGGALGLGLGLFHFLVEPRLEGRIEALVKAQDEAATEKVTRYLQIVPRVGFGLLLVVVISMMIFARGA